MIRELGLFVTVFDERHPDPDLELVVGDVFSHTDLVAFRRAVGAMFPTLDPEAIRTCVRWVDLVELAMAHDLSPKRWTVANLNACEGFSTRLRPIRPEDVVLLYEASLDPVEAHRWRSRGRDVGFDAFQRRLHEGVLSQFIVESLDEQLPIGTVVAYAYQPGAGHCAVGFQRLLKGVGLGGDLIEGMGIFLLYLFRTFPLRKVFFEVPEFNTYLVEPTAAGTKREAVISDFYYHDGRYWEKRIYSFDAEAANAIKEHWVESEQL
jgi:hypothetical protein